jgi:TadE-like protein
VRSPHRVGRRASSRGQSLVEFSVSVPIFVMLLFGMLEFGFAFNHNMTLEYATREGARAGAALANGTTSAPCARIVGTPGTPGVDDRIIAAVQRVLTSPGSPVVASQVSMIRIYRATSSDNSGNEDPGKVNVWVPGAGMTVDSVPLKFTETTVGWNACGRDNGATPDSIGVSLTYTYRLISPLGIFLGMTGSATFQMSDRTVMALNPN